MRTLLIAMVGLVVAGTPSRSDELCMTPNPAAFDDLSGFLIVDDFEVGSFSVTSTGDLVVDTQSGLPTSSVLGGERTVTVSTFSDRSATARLILFSGIDDAVDISAIDEASITFSYGPFDPPVDVTAGGTLDRFVVEGVEFSAVGRVNVSVRVSGGGHGIGGRDPTAGTITYFYDEFPGSPDFTTVEQVSLQVILNETGSAEVSNFLALPEPSAALLAISALAAVAGLAARGRRARHPRSLRLKVDGVPSNPSPSPRTGYSF